jgi:pimeloyl-ACP methyl ester carboxylesterase
MSVLDDIGVFDRTRQELLNLHRAHQGFPRFSSVGGPRVGALTETITDATRYVLRTFGSRAGLRGLAVESAWCAAHLTGYSLGLLGEHITVDGGETANRTESLGLAQRSLTVSDMNATGTPILLVHGLMDNRSVFTVFRGALRKRGFGVVHAVNYSAFTRDVRFAAAELHGHVERLCERTGADRIHIIGHSLGGLIARYYVQRLGGDYAVDTVVTLGSPHGGTMAAHLLPTPLGRQLTPDSDLLTELAEPAPDCRTRFLAVWSKLDQLILPQRNGRLVHPDLDVHTLPLRDVGHMSLAIDPRIVDWVATSLTPLEGSALAS